MKTIQHSHASHAHRTSNGGDNEFMSDVESLKNGFTQLRSDVTELMQTAAHAGRTGVAAVKDGAGHAVDGITETIGDRLIDLKKTSQQSVKAVKKQIGTYPVASAMIALGAGFILAKFFSRK